LKSDRASKGFEQECSRPAYRSASAKEWIAKQAAHPDAVISHPRLVETGLDLFDMTGQHHSATIGFHETGHKLSTLRQAGRMQSPRHNQLRHAGQQ
jgi:hypothetical protein